MHLKKGGGDGGSDPRSVGEHPPYRFRTVPYRTVPYRTVPYRTVPYRTVPYRTVPYRTVPYRTVPYRTVRWFTAAFFKVTTLPYLFLLILWFPLLDSWCLSSPLLSALSHSPLYRHRRATSNTVSPMINLSHSPVLEIWTPSHNSDNTIDWVLSACTTAWLHYLVTADSTFEYRYLFCAA
jgi:hypothetical protein